MAPTPRRDSPVALTGQAEDYLKVMYHLERSGAAAATSDIAAELGVAPASVSGMLQRLARLGLVRVERYRGARQCVVEGGDHGFSDFARHLETVFEFGEI